MITSSTCTGSEGNLLSSPATILTTLLNSPHLEKLKDKNYEVLLMTDPVDEWVVQSLTEYDGKPLKSAEKGDLEIDERRTPRRKTSITRLCSGSSRALEDEIKEVKPSSA